MNGKRLVERPALLRSGPGSHSFGDGFLNHKETGLLHTRESVGPGNLLEPVGPWAAQFL
jgi:hypothetical protein